MDERDTFGKLAAGDEGIPTNILSDRLKRMEEAGLIEAKPYQERPVRYSYALTDKGRDLSDVLTALARWGKKHIRGTVVAPEFRRKKAGARRRLQPGSSWKTTRAFQAAWSSIPG